MSEIKHIGVILQGLKKDVTLTIRKMMAEFDEVLKEQLSLNPGIPAKDGRLTGDGKERVPE